MKNLKNKKNEVNQSALDRPLDPYSIDKMANLPVGVKVAFLKFWAAGAVCYFINIGTFISDPLDLLVLDALVLGLVIEYIINNVIRWMNNDNNKTLHYLMVNKKNLASLFLNMFYSITLVSLILLAHILIGRGIDYLGMDLISDLSFGSSPIIFGLLFLFFDYILVKLKNLIFKKKVENNEV